MNIKSINNIITAKIRNFLPTGSYGRAITVLVTSTAIGQAILVASLPILTRLYQPQDMGKFGIFTSFLSVAIIGSCLRYEIAAVASKTDEDATLLLFLCCFITLGTSIISTGILFVLIAFNYLGFGSLPLLITCITMFMALLIISSYQMLKYFLLRGNNYGLLGKTNITQSGTRVLTQLFMGIFGAGYVGLVVGELLGKLAGFIRMLKRVISLIGPLRAQLNFRKMLEVAKKNKEYPCYSLPSALIDTLTFSLPIPLIAQKFGIEAAGLYALANRVLALPLSLIGASVADAFHGKSASYLLNESKKIKLLFMSSAKKLFWLGLGPMLVFAVLSPKLFGVVFGAKWYTAGLLAAVLVPWTFCQLIVSPLSRVIFVIGGQAKKFIYDFTAIVALIGGIYGSSYLEFSFIQTMMVVSTLGVVSYLVYFLILHHLINRYVLLKELG